MTVPVTPPGCVPMRFVDNIPGVDLILLVPERTVMDWPTLNLVETLPVGTITDALTVDELPALLVQ